MSKSKSQIKKLPTAQPKDVLKVELPPPELKKVEIPPKKTVLPDIGFWDLLWLLIKSVLRNKARDAMGGKEDVNLRGFQNLAGFIMGGGSWEWELLEFVYYFCSFTTYIG
ncbi:MAG: hypothetical protein L0Y80_01020 [Ignavibacteriae bacterium]|nr:hypothetical protein [Ignavibacteriota bacterium]